MCKIGTISLIFLLVFGGLVIQESPYWLWSIPFLVLGIVIPMIKGMWDASGWINEQILSKEEFSVDFKIE